MSDKLVFSNAETIRKLLEQAYSWGYQNGKNDCNNERWAETTFPDHDEKKAIEELMKDIQ